MLYLSKVQVQNIILYNSSLDQSDSPPYYHKNISAVNKLLEHFTTAEKGRQKSQIRIGDSWNFNEIRDGTEASTNMDAETRQTSKQ